MKPQRKCSLHQIVQKEQNKQDTYWSANQRRNMELSKTQTMQISKRFIFSRMFSRFIRSFLK